MELSSDPKNDSVDKVDAPTNKDDLAVEESSSSDASKLTDVPNKSVKSTNESNESEDREPVEKENQMDIVETQEINRVDEINNLSDITPMEVDEVEPVKENESQSDKENPSILSEDKNNEKEEEDENDEQKDISANQSQSSNKEINESTDENDENSLVICETGESENTDESRKENESIDNENLDISKDGSSNDVESSEKDQNVEKETNCNVQITEEACIRETSEKESNEQTVECNDVEMESESGKNLTSEKNSDVEKTEFVQINQEKDDSQLDNQSEAVDPFASDNLSIQTDNVECMEVDSGSANKNTKSAENKVIDKETETSTNTEKDAPCSNDKSESKTQTVDATEEVSRDGTEETVEEAPEKTTKEAAEKTTKEAAEVNKMTGEKTTGTSEPASDLETDKSVEKSVESASQETAEKKNNESTAEVLPGQDDELCIIPDSTKEKSIEKSHTVDTSNAEKEKDKEDDILIEGEFPKSSETAKSSEVSEKDSTSEPSKTTDDSSSLKVAALTTGSNAIQVNLEKSPDGPSIVTSDIIDIDDDAKSSEVEEISAKEVCKQCSKEKTCPIKVKVGTKNYSVCSETCKTAFANDNNKATDIPSEGVNSKREKRCANCLLIVEAKDERNLSWETMEFCNEECLGKFQTKYGSYCRNCNGAVQPVSLGKYCVRFGYDVRQFCCSTCLEEFKKGLKVCSYCQKDISAGTEGFLAPVGDKGQFKDFCTQDCMEKYSKMNSTEPPTPEKKVCDVCQEEKVMHCEVQIDRNPAVAICSEPCFAAFGFVNKVDPDQCSTCKKYFQLPTKKGFIVFYEDEAHTFCNKTCLNVFIITNRKIVPCNWCKVKKYNFDMIKKELKTGQVMMMCSLNCLTLYQVSINAVSARRIHCDFCKEYLQAQYHLTMSDATIRNFCSYTCVMKFQAQYTKSPITIPTSDAGSTDPVPTGIPKRAIQPAQHPRGQATAGADLVAIAPKKTMPVISSVTSLAAIANGQAQNTVQLPAAQSNVSAPMQPITLQGTAPIVYKQQVVTRPTSPVDISNKMTQCRPQTHTKGVSVRPIRCDQSTQTDTAPEKVVIPLPIPIPIPVPVHMYHMPFPVPVPIPLPIPVPIFIPTTRNSVKGIFKELKRIQEKIPADPFEAELLMMAEMVATEKKNESDSDSNDDVREDDEVNDNAAGGDSYSPEVVDSSNAFGEDMLQIALKMATGELDEQAVDLDTALTPNTIQTPRRQQNDEATENNVPPERVHSGRGRKRGSSFKMRGMPSKRGRRAMGPNNVGLLSSNNQISASGRLMECAERPDANMALKYTYGVNAWRQWVITKNAELEKQSTPTRKLKLFKTDLLQLTADELNYSLCLFVKELRKPNGAEYEPDTIFYLCLGIQQYLFENSRIDNIFTDTFYEKFTDCLNDIAKKFASLYDNAPRIITRVEEEHLWECKQLGAHSPHVLLNTLMYFNTKHFNLTSVEEHMQLSFSHIMKHWKRNPTVQGSGKVTGSRNVLLRFYPPQSTLESNSKKKKVYEQQENENNILRCPVKLYEFYLSKCPESVKTRNDVFYLLPERSCVPDSPVWYSTSPLAKEHLIKMLYRIKMVKEINVAVLSS